MAAETRPLLIVSTTQGLLAEPLFVKVELDPIHQAATANDYGGRQRAQRGLIAQVQERLEAVPGLVVEPFDHRLSGVPYLALSPILTNYRDETERAAKADALLAALAGGGERLDGFALAHWAARPRLGQRFEPCEDGQIPNPARVAASGPVIRSVLAPWLAGRLPVSDMGLFRAYHLNFDDDVHALCGFVVVCNNQADDASIAGYDGINNRLLGLLPALVGDGWLSEGQGKYGRTGKICKIGPKLRRLARYEILIY
jgi:hypothetical protein